MEEYLGKIKHNNRKRRQTCLAPILRITIRQLLEGLLVEGSLLTITINNNQQTLRLKSLNHQLRLQIPSQQILPQQILLQQQLNLLLPIFLAPIRQIKSPHLSVIQQRLHLQQVPIFSTIQPIRLHKLQIPYNNKVNFSLIFSEPASQTGGGIFNTGTQPSVTNPQPQTTSTTNPLQTQQSTNPITNPQQQVQKSEGQSTLL